MSTPDPEILTIPPATAATPDLVCWLWAAYPEHRGRLPVRKIAADLGVSERTIRRWIADGAGRDFDAETQARIAQRAILRGKGTYLWPDLDEGSLIRHQAVAANAEISLRAILNDRYPLAWDNPDNGTMTPHDVVMVHYPRAHVFAIAAINDPKSRQHLERRAEILRVEPQPNKWAALLVKHRALATMAEHRCITPRRLVPRGRTDTWREAGGPAKLRAPRDPHALLHTTG